MGFHGAAAPDPGESLVSGGKWGRASESRTLRAGRGEMGQGEGVVCKFSDLCCSKPHGASRRSRAWRPLA